jgi:two-component system sensor histidine kinase/response regulator
MDPTTSGSDAPAPSVIGRILDGPYSKTLKRMLATRISQCQNFDAAGGDAMFYIAAWGTDDDTIWYEFASRAFLRLFACDGQRLPSVFRESILERRVYRYAATDNTIVRQIYTREELQEIRKRLRTGDSEAGIMEATYKVAVSGGSPRWLKDRAAVTDYPSDGVCLSMGQLMDVTKEMTAEAQLKKAHGELKAARNAAEAASRIKSEFLSNISHEVRTPLNGILGMCELIERSRLDRRQREYTHILRTAAEALLTLVNDILDFSKTESGKLTLEEMPFISRNVMEDIRDIFMERVAERDIEMHVALSPDVPEQLVGDPYRLRQVLVNLVDNALKFTKSGTIHISVDTRGLSDDKEELLFCVRDSGIGIAPKSQENLFDAFTQADGSAARQYGGTGLGLAICKRIVALMGGTIWVESGPESGSAFYFTARFRHYQDPDDADADIPDRIRSLKVLIVEDNRATQLILRRAMASFGCRVVTAFSAEEALAAYESQPPEAPFDLLLMDISLPGMDGVTAAEAIKRVHRLPPPPIIIISASGRDDEIKRADAAGIDSYLIKPVKKSLLLDTLKDIFGTAPSGQTGVVLDDADPAGCLAGVRVLVVEDNPINRRVAKEVLKTADIVVDLAENGADAVAAATERRYDAILMDIQMPGMDGLEAAQRIRGKLGPSAPPVIAMTAYVMGSDREKFLAAGLKDVIPKPLERRQVFATLSRYISPVTTDPVHSVRRRPLPEHVAPASPESLEGLDVAKAMERFHGNWRLYADVLDTVCRSAAFQGAMGVDHETPEAAGALGAQATALKEAAVRIAAPELFSAAAAVATAVAAGDEAALRPAVAELSAQMDRVKQSAARLLAGVTTTRHDAARR